MSGLYAPDQLPQPKFEVATYDKRLEKSSSLGLIILYIILVSKEVFEIVLLTSPLQFSLDEHLVLEEIGVGFLNTGG